MTPYALRRRMAHGNIYPPEKVDAALGNYFREGNLGALRELALLWMADRVDESLQDYMKDRRHRGAMGDARADPGRRRRAARGRALDPASGADGGATRRRPRRRQRRSRRTASPRPGATRRHPRTRANGRAGRSVRWSAGGIAEALLEVAKAENVTQIVIGASSHSRWREFFRGSVVHRDHPRLRSHRCPRDSARTRRRREGASPRRPRPGSPGTGDSPGRWWRRSASSRSPWSWSSSRQHLSLSSVILLYLTLVVGVAAIGGLWPAVVVGDRIGPAHQLVLHRADPHVDDRRRRERPGDRRLRLRGVRR